MQGEEECRGSGRQADLVGDAVENLHGQVGHLREGVGGQVQQDPPYLRVDTVEGDP